MQIQGIKIAKSLYNQQFKEFSEGKRLSASWVLYGIQNNLKYYLSLALAADILSVDASSGQLTEIKVNENCHPDLLIIDKNEIIKIADIRAAIQFSRSTSIESNNKVIIINKVETLTVAAANALLKLLEEPKNGLTIILLCNNLGNLLPTIRSRVFKLRLLNSKDEELFQQYQQHINVDAETLKLIIKYIGVVNSEEELNYYANFFTKLKGYTVDYRIDDLADLINNKADIFTYFCDYVLNAFHEKSILNIENKQYPNEIISIKTLLNNIIIYNLDAKYYLSIILNKLQCL